MERSFGHDFGKVRVHADQQAAQSAQEVNALAYTVGSHVVLNKGQYEPKTSFGLRLMAHELAHVVQQQNAGGTPEAGVIGAPDHPSELEADRAADSVLGGAARTEIGVSEAMPPVLRRQTASGPATPAAVPSGLPGEARMIASFDVSPGNKRPWNANQLARDIIGALSASNLAFVTVLGAYPTKVTEDDPKGSAYQRANMVRRALIQWIGPKKFDETRYQVGLSSGSPGDPEIQVEISYKPQIISEGSGATSEAVTSTPPAKADSAKTQAAPVPSLFPTQPYPASTTDAFSAFLETSPGQQFKTAALKQLKAVWAKTSTAEKIIVIVNLLATVGAASYGIAKMSPGQQKGILDLIVSDDDKLLQQPLPAKTQLEYKVDF
jgi:hypothetical protein